MKKKLIVITMFIITMLINPLVVNFSFGQPPIDDIEPIPMDNGLIFLLIAGFLLGLVTLYKQRKRIKT